MVPCSLWSRINLLSRLFAIDVAAGSVCHREMAGYLCGIHWGGDLGSRAPFACASRLNSQAGGNGSTLKGGVLWMNSTLQEHCEQKYDMRQFVWRMSPVEHSPLR